MDDFDDFVRRQEEADASIQKSVVGLQTDVVTLKGQIADLQASLGQLTPEQQSKLNTIAATTENLAEQLHTLDESTAPPVPKEEPPAAVADEGVADETTTEAVPGEVKSAVSKRRR